MSAADLKQATTSAFTHPQSTCRTARGSGRARPFMAEPDHPQNVLTGASPSDLGKAVLVALAVLTPVVGLGFGMMYQQWRAQEVAAAAAFAASQSHERMVAAPTLALLDGDSVARGRDIFLNACVACHGKDARGISGLGKNLAESDFVAAQDDAQLFNFLVTGRPEAKPIPMLPRGGRPDLSDDDLRHVAVYLRGVQDPRRMPALAAVSVAAPSQSEKDKALAAAGGDAELAGYIASGSQLYNSTCIACHGAAGVGIPGNGKKLADNVFIQSLNDDNLLAFVKQGRAPSDPKNTTGIQMPPKGGNPAMSDDDILDVVAYLRTLQPAGTTRGK